MTVLSLRIKFLTWLLTELKKKFVDKDDVLKNAVVVGDVLRMKDAANDLRVHHNCDVIHVVSGNKDVTAATKIIDQIKYFVETSLFRSTIILIVIKGSKHNKLILIHQNSNNLMSCADEQYSF